MGHAANILATRTTTRLLDALHDEGASEAWAAIDARYRPVVAALARRLGLTDADAEDVAQHTLAEFVRAYRQGRYDRAKGRLSSWILGIAHHTALRVRRRGQAQADPSGSGIEDQPDLHADEPALRAIWNQERDRALLSHAMTLLREDSGIDERTLLAFELTGLRGVPTDEASRQCGMSPEQVAVAKSRVTRRLREMVAQLEDAFELDA